MKLRLAFSFRSVDERAMSTRLVINPKLSLTCKYKITLTIRLLLKMIGVFLLSIIFVYDVTKVQVSPPRIADIYVA